MAQALPREHPDLDFCLVEPASMGGRVVDRKSAPDLGAELRTVKVDQRLAAMDIEIVQHQVDGLDLHKL